MNKLLNVQKATVLSMPNEVVLHLKSLAANRKTVNVKQSVFKNSHTVFDDEVLNTLLYRIFEIYIDDVNIFGNSPEDFVTRLRKFFSRIRLHKIILKPFKCYLGYADLQLFGKVISQEGLRMSQSKIQLVLDFPCPTVSKQLKSFLGLVNYFRDSIRNQSTIVRPLHAYLQIIKEQNG